MITEIIDKSSYEHVVKYCSVTAMHVKTLDGIAIRGGLADLVYITPEVWGYKLYNRLNRKYYHTLVILKAPDGSLVNSYTYKAEGVIYKAFRPGRYPDNNETYQRFVQGRKVLSVKKHLAQAAPHLKSFYRPERPGQRLIRYPGNLYVLDQGKQHKKSDRFLYARPYRYPYWGFNCKASLKAWEPRLFNLFLLHASEF